MSLRGARKIFQTARSILKRDPVAHSLLEVFLTYPGIRVLFGTESLTLWLFIDFIQLPGS